MERKNSGGCEILAEPVIRNENSNEFPFISDRKDGGKAAMIPIYDWLPHLYQKKVVLIKFSGSAAEDTLCVG